MSTPQNNLSPNKIEMSEHDDHGCILCGVTFTSKKNANDHLSGQKHQKKLQASASPALRIGNSATETSVNVMAPTSRAVTSDSADCPQEIIDDHGCILCGVTFTSKKNADDHLSGQKHQKKLQASTSPSVNVMAPTSRAVTSDSAYCPREIIDDHGCILCGITFTSKKHADDHLSGQKHQKKLQASTSPSVNVMAPTSRAVTSDSADHPQEILAPATSPLVGAPSQVLMCSVCHVPFTGIKCAEQHFESVKHKKKAALFEQNKILTSSSQIDFDENSVDKNKPQVKNLVESAFSKPVSKGQGTAVTVSPNPSFLGLNTPVHFLPKPEAKYPMGHQLPEREDGKEKLLPTQNHIRADIENIGAKSSSAYSQNENIFCEAKGAEYKVKFSDNVLSCICESDREYLKINKNETMDQASDIFSITDNTLQNVNEGTTGESYTLRDLEENPLAGNQSVIRDRAEILKEEHTKILEAKTMLELKMMYIEHQQLYLKQQKQKCVEDVDNNDQGHRKKEEKNRTEENMHTPRLKHPLSPPGLDVQETTPIGVGSTINSSATSEGSTYYFNGNQGVCRCCNIVLTSVQHTREHINGAPHKRSRGIFNAHADGKDTQLECNICSKKFSGRESAIEHFDSIKHQQKVNNAAKLQQQYTKEPPHMHQQSPELIMKQVQCRSNDMTASAHVPVTEQLPKWTNSPSASPEICEIFCKTVPVHGTGFPTSHKISRMPAAERLDMNKQILANDVGTVARTQTYSLSNLEMRAVGFNQRAKKHQVTTEGIINTTQEPDRLAQGTVNTTSSAALFYDHSSAGIGRGSTGSKNTVKQMDRNKPIAQTQQSADIESSSSDEESSGNSESQGSSRSEDMSENCVMATDVPIQRMSQNRRGTPHSGQRALRDVTKLETLSSSDSDDSDDNVSDDFQRLNITDDEFSGSVQLPETDVLKHKSHKPPRSPIKDFKYTCPTCEQYMNTKTDYYAHINSNSHQHRLSIRRAPKRQLPPTDNNVSNVRDMIHGLTKSTARIYQLELLEKTMEEDTIVYLPTGTGKTLVSIMTMAAMLRLNPRRPVLFLVDKVLLVLQQAKYIISQLSGRIFLRPNLHRERELVGRELLVKVICGGLASKSEIPVYQHDIIVTTAAFCENMLEKEIIHWEDFSLVVLDEVHHCRKRHPYYKLLKSRHCSILEQQSRPKVLGLTASPAGKKDTEQTYRMLRQLLSDLGNAKIAMVESEAGNEFLNQLKSNAQLHPICVPMSPKEREFEHTLLQYFLFCYAQFALRSTTLCHNNQPPCSYFMEVVQDPRNKEKVIKIANQLLVDPEPLIEILPCITEAKCGIDDQTLFKELREHLCQLLLIIPTIGTGTNSVDELISKFSSDDNQSIMMIDGLGLPHEEMIRLVRQFDRDGSADQSLFSKLVQILKDPGYINFSDKRSKALVLVTERKQAKRLCKKLRKEAFVKDGDLKVSTLVGHGQGGSEKGMPVRAQKKVLDNHQRIDIIVATSIAEEGVDFQTLQLVVCMNPPTSVRALVQMRGRARRRNSHFVIMCRSEEEMHKLDELQRQERRMQKAAQRCVDEDKLVQRLDKANQTKVKEVM